MAKSNNGHNSNKTKGAKRGYIETQQVITKNVDEFEDFSDEELLEIANKGYGKK